MPTPYETLMEMKQRPGYRKVTPEQEAQQLGLRQEGIRTEAAQWGLKQQKEAWEFQKQQSVQTANLTQQFLSQWGTGMEDLKGLYDRILSGQTGGSGPLADLQTKIMEEYESFKTEYQPIEREFFEQAREELGVRKGLVGQMAELAKPDYEGVAGRAGADVTAQSEMARQAEARRTMSLGLDPTSGRFGALTRRSFLDEARNRVIAMNVARRGEKERVTGVTGAALQLIDPSRTAEVGLGIQERRTGMLGTAADIGVAQAGVQKAQAEMVGGYARDVVRPYGELGFTLLGHQLGQGVPTPGTYVTPGTPAAPTAPAPAASQPPKPGFGGGGGSSLDWSRRHGFNV